MGASGFGIHLRSLNNRKRYDLDGVRRMFVRIVREELDGPLKLRGGAVGLEHEMITVGGESADAVTFWFDDRVDWELSLAVHWVRAVLARQRARVESGLREQGCALDPKGGEPYPVLRDEIYGQSGLFFAVGPKQIGLVHSGDVHWQLPKQRTTPRGKLTPAARQVLDRVLARGICGCPLCARLDLGYPGRDKSVRGRGLSFVLERVARAPASFAQVRDELLELVDRLALAPIQHSGLLAEPTAAGFLDIGDQLAGRLTFWADDPPGSEPGLIEHWLRLALAIGRGDVAREIGRQGFRLGKGPEPYPTVRSESTRRERQLGKACACNFCVALGADFSPDTALRGFRAQLLAVGTPRRHVFTGAVALADRSVVASVDFGGDSHVLRVVPEGEPEPITGLATCGSRIACLVPDGDGVASWSAPPVTWSPWFGGYQWTKKQPAELAVWRPRAARIQRRPSRGLGASGHFNRVFQNGPLLLAQLMGVGGRGTIVGSTDRGRTWQTIASPPRYLARKTAWTVEFWEFRRASDRPELQFGTSEQGTWRTRDAGRTFERVKLPAGFVGEALCLGARGVVGVFGRDPRGGALARSIDGGDSFGPLARPPGARLSGARTPDGADFVCAATGDGEHWFWGLHDRKPDEPGLFCSRDAGVSWVACARGPVRAIFPDRDVDAAFFARPGKLFRVEPRA